MRSTKTLDKSMEEFNPEGASPDELKKMIKQYQEKITHLNHDIEDAQEEKKHANDDFESQLAKVRDEFAEMSKIAIKEQEELQTKINELEEELEQAKTKE